MPKESERVTQGGRRARRASDRADDGKRPDLVLVPRAELGRLRDEARTGQLFGRLCGEAMFAHLFAAACDPEVPGVRDLSLNVTLEDGTRRVAVGQAPLQLLESALRAFEVRECVLCGQSKPLSAFSLLAKGPEGRNRRCKVCEAARVRAHKRRKDAAAAQARQQAQAGDQGEKAEQHQQAPPAAAKDNEQAA